MPQFDHYAFRARLQPALFTLFPLALAVIAWTGGKQPWMAVLWTFGGTAGATYFLAVAVRNRGKQIEPTLWSMWGGAPTTQLLRHAGPANPIMRERWHRYLARLLAVRLPTAEEEAADRPAADHAYEAGTKLLIAKTRDTKKYSLIYKENVAYGFCRNLYAMRPIGIFIAGVGLVASAGASIGDRGHEIRFVAWACVALNSVFLLGWVTRVTADWVKVPAFAYAERLLEAVESLSRAKAVSAATAAPSK
jgi:hypothetical protein